TTGNNNSNNGPELINYPGDCVAGNKLQLTRGNRLLYGAPGHTMYNHIRGPNDMQMDCRGGLPHSTRNFYWWSRLSHNVASTSTVSGGAHTSVSCWIIKCSNSGVNRACWQSLGRRNGKEIVGDY